MQRRTHRLRPYHLILAAGLAMAAGLVLLAGACGGGVPDDARQTQAPAAEATAQATKKPEPVSSLPPLVKMGETVRFLTPEGAVVQVTAGDYADPGDAPDGVNAETGERLVTLELTVTAEGEAGTAAVKAPFKKDSFMLIAEDDTITVAQLGDDALLGAIVPPGEPLHTTLAFSVGAAAQRLFLCTPAEGSRPRSATWKLD
jgi:hypothetical protein